MDRNNVLKRIETIFKELFKDEELKVTEATSMESIENWDSLSNAMLINEIEKKFSVKFKYREISNLANVGDMIDLLENHNV